MNTLHFFQPLRRAALVFAATSVISTGVFAQTPLPNSDASTAAFVALCQNRADVEAQNFCFGFGEGVYQSSLMQRSPSAKPTICVPKGMSRDTVLSEFLVWTQARPQYNGEYAAKTIIRFLSSRYPCAKTP
ncbi:Rap1a/Tai family immunity protein [Polynucleobacter sp.]|uniref:Rap1a/Tai family immunity protein n=1 Tax=Polynucleobacter sp. TaxID=2029855 RepID=UPI00273747BC|nr:Rap1a/Tai family immunity protein [Polynucleobacter sp.]MDP3121169.1 Rap1a/Tai family immunity protein [Polynucleobacter sp.]